MVKKIYFGLLGLFMAVDLAFASPSMTVYFSNTAPANSESTFVTNTTNQWAGTLTLNPNPLFPNTYTFMLTGPSTSYAPVCNSCCAVCPICPTPPACDSCCSVCPPTVTTATVNAINNVLSQMSLDVSVLSSQVSLLSPSSLSVSSSAVSLAQTAVALVVLSTGNYYVAGFADGMDYQNNVDIGMTAVLGELCGSATNFMLIETSTKTFSTATCQDTLNTIINEFFQVNLSTPTPIPPNGDP